MRASAFPLSLALLLAAAFPSRSSNWYVQAGGAGSRTGSSWLNAVATVTAALAKAQNGDTVFVSDDTFSENVTVPSGVKLKGGYTYDDTMNKWYQSPGDTTLDGGHKGPVITIAVNAASTTLVNGFTIQNGSGVAATINTGDEWVVGGGIYFPSGAATFSQNIFRSNSAQYGGAVFAAGDCTFEGNGFIGNRATINGGAVSCFNGLCNFHANSFINNSAQAGGGISVEYYATADIRSNIFQKNLGSSIGSAIYLGEDGTVHNNTIVYNGGGGAALGLGKEVILVGSNNIIAFNLSGGLQGDDDDMFGWYHNDTYGNVGFDGLSAPPITGWHGNFSADPAFLSEASLVLRTYSPCVDAGDGSVIVASDTDYSGKSRSVGAGPDLGAYETTVSNSKTAIRVSTTGNDANNGSTWALAKRTIPAALSTANGADEVWVAAGTYGKVSIMSSDVSSSPTNAPMYGGFKGTETARWQRDPTSNPTILDGGDSGTVLDFQGMGVAGTVVDGFLIRSGSGWYASPVRHGGGISIRNGATPLIKNNEITGNSAEDAYTWGLGGGIYCASNAQIISNSIHGNQALEGGGIYCAADAFIAYNNIYGNTAGGRINPPAVPSGYDYDGGGIRVESSPNAIIEHNLIHDNNSQSKGGGLLLGEATVTRNQIYGNSAYLGGGIDIDRSLPTLLSNRITGNRATGRGGGINAYYSGPDSTHVMNAYNNTISDNSGEGIYLTNSTAHFVNNIVAFNSEGIVDDPSGPGTLQLGNNDVYSNGANYSGVGAGSNDIQTDPLFNSRGTGDYHLLIGSGCIDTGDSTVVPSGAYDVDGAMRVQGTHVDIGAFESAVGAAPGGGDVAQALRIAAGLAASDATSKAHYDVITSSPSQNRVDILDVTRLAREAVGLDP